MPIFDSKQKHAWHPGAGPHQDDPTLPKIPQEQRSLIPAASGPANPEQARLLGHWSEPGPESDLLGGEVPAGLAEPLQPRRRPVQLPRRADYPGSGRAQRFLAAVIRSLEHAPGEHPQQAVQSRAAAGGADPPTPEPVLPDPAMQDSAEREDPVASPFPSIPELAIYVLDNLAMGMPPYLDPADVEVEPALEMLRRMHAAARDIEYWMEVGCVRIGASGEEMVVRPAPSEVIAGFLGLALRDAQFLPDPPDRGVSSGAEGPFQDAMIR